MVHLRPWSDVRRWSSRASWASWFVFLATLLLRLATRAHLPTEWDSVQFVLGVDHFDVTQDSPNAPGYWSYVALARLVRAVTPLDAHSSLVLLAAVASAATGTFMFLVGRQLAGDWLGWVAAAFWATNPIAWFYGSIANTKVFDAVAITGVVVLALHARPGGPQALGTAALVGVAGGFRPTALLLLGPVSLITLLRCCRRPIDVVPPLLVGAAATASWMVPMALEQPGGLATIRAVNDFMFQLSARKTSVFYGAEADAVMENAGRALVAALVAVAPVLPLFVLGLIGRLVGRAEDRLPTHAGLLAAAMVPGLLFTVLLHFGTAGHTLGYLPATLLILLSPLAVVRPRFRSVATVGVVLLTLASAQRFLAGAGPVPVRLASHRWIPSGQSLAGIRYVDDDIRRHIAIGSVLDPSRDVFVFIVGNGEERFRPLSLFLDQFAGHFVNGHQDAMTAYRRQGWFDEDSRIEVPPGGRAIVLLKHDDPAVIEDGGAGAAEVLRLGDGVVARAAPAGASVSGVAVVVDAGAFRPKTDAAHRRPCGGGPC